MHESMEGFDLHGYTQAEQTSSEKKITFSQVELSWNFKDLLRIEKVSWAHFGELLIEGENNI